VAYRDELEEKIAHQDSGLSAGCGCMIWLFGIFGTAILMGVIDVFLFDGWNLLGPPPTFWDSLGHWLFIFSPQSIFILIYAIYRWRHKLRGRAIGLCANCGYDLRATPDPKGPLLPICPECGRKTSW